MTTATVPSTIAAGPQRTVENGATYLGDRSAIGQGKPDGRLSRLGVPDSQLQSTEDCVKLFEELKKRQVDYFGPLEKVSANVMGEELLLQFPVNPTQGVQVLTTLQTEGQLCRMLSIPTDYFVRCPADLQADQLNHWLKQIGSEERTEKRMWRTQDQRIRALLTARYKRLSHLDVSREVHSRLAKKAKLHGAWLSDNAFHTMLYLPDVALPVTGGKGGDDKLFVGMHVWNGETGKTRFGYTSFLFRAVCCNFNLWGFEEGEASNLYHKSDTTLRNALANMGTAMDRLYQERDKVTAVVRAAQSDTLLDFGGKSEKLVEALRRVGFTKEAIEGAIKAAKAEFGGAITRWSLVQGFTSTSQQLAVDERMRVDTLAGKVLVKAILN